MKNTEFLVLVLAIIFGMGLIIGGVMVMAPLSPMLGSFMTSNDNHGMMSEDEFMLDEAHEEVEVWYSHMREHMEENEDHEEVEDWDTHMEEHMEGEIEEDECYEVSETQITT